MLVPRPDKCAVAALNSKTIQGGTRVNQDVIHGGNGLTEVTLKMPFNMDGQRFGARLDVPDLGSYSKELLAELGYGNDKIAQLEASGTVKSA